MELLFHSLISLQSLAVSGFAVHTPFTYSCIHLKPPVSLFIACLRHTSCLTVDLLFAILNQEKNLLQSDDVCKASKFYITQIMQGVVLPLAFSLRTHIFWQAHTNIGMSDYRI